MLGDFQEYPSAFLVGIDKDVDFFFFSIPSANCFRSDYVNNV